MENFYSSYPSPEGEESTLRMDQLMYASQWGPEEAVERDEERIWQRINMF